MTAVLGVLQFTKKIFIILIFTKMISFACAFAVFLLFSEHIRMAASDYHSNLSIVLNIFRKKQHSKIYLFLMTIRLQLISDSSL